MVRPWHEYAEGLRYMRQTPLIVGIALINIGWATGGGAAQILFSLFGEIVFHRGAAGIGTIWASPEWAWWSAGRWAHWLGRRVSFSGYKWTIAICYVVHGGAYVIFSQMEQYWAALVFIALSRAAVAVSSSVLNFAQLLRHVPDEYRGRVFATIESMTWSTMMVSMMAAGIASQSVSPRTIGVWAGVLSSSTALFWGWLNLADGCPSRLSRASSRRRWRCMESQPSSLEGKVVLVTGAAKRIGRGIALRLAREGARVAIHYNTSEGRGAGDRPSSAAARRSSGRIWSGSPKSSDVRGSREPHGEPLRPGQQRRAVQPPRTRWR